MPVTDLAIIVTSFQMPWHLRRTLETIAGQHTSRQLEVVVADDGSRDETPHVVAEFAARASFPVRFVTHPHAGFHAARCRNEGARHSTAGHLLFVDGDCLLPTDHVEQHLQAPRLGLVTCSYCVRLDQQVSQDVSLEVARGGQFARWPYPEERRKLRQMHLKSLWYRLLGHPTKPAFRSGNFALARSDFERVNGFDENFIGWGCEDDDFGRRMRAAKIQPVSILNRTCVYHLWHPPSPSRPSEWKQGDNVGYLQRAIRLTRCLNGYVRRTPFDLTVRLTDGLAAGPQVQCFLALQRWNLVTDDSMHTDLELRFHPGRGRFSGRSDCRVLAVLEMSDFPIDLSDAHVVLSPRAEVGLENQVRLRLDDVEGLWSVLQGSALPASDGLPRRRAA